MYNNEWLNCNSFRKFPFMHECSLKDSTRKFTLPNSFMVDALLSVTIDFQNLWYVSKIVYSPELLSITVSTLDTEALIGSVQNPSGKNIVVTLYGKDVYEGSIGKIVVGSLEQMLYGEFSFFGNDTIIEPCRVVKLCQGVSSINGITSGNVTLTSGSNVVITKNGNQIVIDTMDGLCACDETPCIKSINGVEPVNTDFQIVGRGCVTVENLESGIEIKNHCEQSCCGCDEINDFIDRMNELQRRITILESLL